MRANVRRPHRDPNRGQLFCEGTLRKFICKTAVYQTFLPNIVLVKSKQDEEA